ncbi:MAG: ribulose-phosphate 3-epimerase [Pseudomonadota bacterium]|nr:ribulose-phosphate 3-epimerase [Pseudomonadota bacterium]MEC7734686.1 ribulose-phosphate 3-epimerase [Pseudomonadota bacterium]MEC9392367.1 ribulose-phosphate 3-epimerase [Pseudomonadota bacterium]MEC9458594.1 ribulose-phosphate 3-epimerase [Pseudomonadota bacterium]MED5437382.1 ribulose-phosphate 3-epimerase [Pseudomonadota bacterium]
MDKKIKIAPSILAADFSKLGDEISAITDAGADYVHVDVMDGHYVPNLTIGPEVIKDIRKCTEIPFDVHLMITPVDPLLEAFSEAGSDIITFHPEAESQPENTIKKIKSLGCKVGISLNPSTKINVLEPLINEIDLVLVMTVVPGFGGQSFMHDQLEKIEKIREMIESIERQIELEVDGGINFETAPLAIEAGADVLVAGTSTFTGGPKNYSDNILKLRSKN